MAKPDNKESSATDEPIFHISNPEQTTHLANDLKRFVEENKLSNNIQGKEYVQVEAWQYAGSRLGLLPNVEDLRSIGTDPEICYQAKVKIVDLRNGATVGTGFAICSNKEASKKYYQQYAIASMAQTRAIGKAYRNIIAWIIRAAGYSPTPYEEMAEMDYIAQPVAASDRPVKPMPMTQSNAQAFEAEVKPPLFDDQGNPVEYCTEEQFKQLSKYVSSSVFTADEQLSYQQKIKKMDTATAQALLNSVKGILDARKAAQKADQPAADTNAPKPITIQQKTNILLLLNNSTITKEEKEKMVAKINILDTVRADQAIAKIKKTIQERTVPVGEELPS